jgi:hypothetical protein
MKNAHLGVGYVHSWGSLLDQLADIGAEMPAQERA